MSSPRGVAALRRYAADGVSVLGVVGNDLALEALPATPIQLAHALEAAGFDHVVPVSWGEELIAHHLQSSLDRHGKVAWCPCRHASDVLAGTRGLEDFTIIRTVTPAVATARLLHAIHRGQSATRIIYLGSTTGAVDPSVDETWDPTEVLAELGATGIDPKSFPTFYEDVIPPDRRRFFSLPGGIPWPAIPGDGRIPFVAIGITARQRGRSIKLPPNEGRVFVDPTVSSRCACIGVTSKSAPLVVAMEPPRAPGPVVEERRFVSLEVARYEAPLITWERVKDAISASAPPVPRPVAPATPAKRWTRPALVRIPAELIRRMGPPPQGVSETPVDPLRLGPGGGGNRWGGHRKRSGAASKRVRVPASHLASSQPEYDVSAFARPGDEGWNEGAVTMEVPPYPYRELVRAALEASASTEGPESSITGPTTAVALLPAPLATPIPESDEVLQSEPFDRVVRPRPRAHIFVSIDDQLASQWDDRLLLWFEANRERLRRWGYALLASLGLFVVLLAGIELTCETCTAHQAWKNGFRWFPSAPPSSHLPKNEDPDEE